MKVQQVKINNTTVTQIYMSKEEGEEKETQDEIKAIKEKNKNVVIFSGGNTTTDKALLDMIKNKMDEI